MAMVQIHENDDGDLCFDIESITVLSRMAWAMAYKPHTPQEINRIVEDLQKDYYAILNQERLKSTPSLRPWRGS